MKFRIKWLLSSPVFITAFAFALRMALLYVWAQLAPNAVTENLPYGYELGRVARAIASGEGFSSPLRNLTTGRTIWYTPAFPYLIAGIFKIWGIYTYTSRTIIVTLNCAFAALTVIPIHGIAKKSFGEGTAVGAAWAWVFLPASLFFPITWLWDTALIALLFAVIFWATLAMRVRADYGSWAGYGALWLLGVLINPSILSLLPFFFGWLAWEAQREKRSWPKPMATALLVFAIGLVPWTVRNHRVMGQWVVLRSNFGLELWLGNNPDVVDTWSPWSHPNDNLEEGLKYQRMGELAYMAQKQHEAITFMRTHPIETVTIMFHRFIETWLGIVDSPKDVWRSGALYGRVLILLDSFLALASFLGALYAHRSGNEYALPFAFVLLVFPLIFYITHTSPRYMFPMDPIMIVLAASVVSRALSRSAAFLNRVARSGAPVATTAD